MNRIICKTIFSVMLVALMVCIAMPVSAKVTAEEAAKLKTELTPIGAEKAGNKEGTIPVWTGGLSKVPDNVKYVAKSGLPHLDPFPDDKPLFTITAQNCEQYKDKLTPGLLKMFKHYPDTWKMNIYPTRRSAAYAQDVYDGTYSNATTAEIVDEYGSTTNFGKGFPFPIPKNGMEAMVNFMLAPHGAKNIKSTQTGGVVQSDGSVPASSATDWFYYAVEGTPKDKFDPQEYVYGCLVFIKMPGREGEIYLLMDPADFRKNEPVGWSYIPGTRRVRRNPNMFYDGMDSSQGGIGTSDEAWVWKGKLDRFDWTLSPKKKEQFVLYNPYRKDLLPDFHEVTTGRHPNPEHMRWELHRVWEVVSTLKPSARHIYSKRIYWLDEDSWLICNKDSYDTRGELWRMQFAETKTFYDFPVARQLTWYNFDFQVEFYVANNFINGMPPENYDPIPDDNFTVQGLRKLGTQ